MLAKVQKLIQDDIDSKQDDKMDVDELADEEDQWKDTGETLSGKGPDGADTLFILQRKGGQMRVRPKGRGKGASQKKPPFQQQRQPGWLFWSDLKQQLAEKTASAAIASHTCKHRHTQAEIDIHTYTYGHTHIHT